MWRKLWLPRLFGGGGYLQGFATSLLTERSPKGAGFWHHNYTALGWALSRAAYCWDCFQVPPEKYGKIIELIVNHGPPDLLEHKCMFDQKKPWAPGKDYRDFLGHLGHPTVMDTLLPSLLGRYSVVCAQSC